MSTKAPGTRDHCRATGPRVCKSSLTWIHQGQPAHEFGTGHSARDRKGQPAPASTKAVAKLDHLGTTSPTIIQISPYSKEKTGLPFKACTAQHEDEIQGNPRHQGQPVPRVYESPMTCAQEGNRPTCPLQLSCETETRQTTQVERLTTPLEKLKREDKEELHAIRIHVNNEMEETQKMNMSTYSNAVGKHVRPPLYKCHLCVRVPRVLE